MSECVSACVYTCMRTFLTGCRCAFFQSMGVSQTHRALIKKKVKEMKVEMEKVKKQKEKEQKAAKKEGRPKDKLEKIGFMKKGKSYTVNTPQ